MLRFTPEELSQTFASENYQFDEIVEKPIVSCLVKIEWLSSDLRMNLKSDRVLGIKI